MVIGGIVPVINIPGAHPGQVKMSGPVLAGIYAGEDQDVERSRELRSSIPVCISRRRRSRRFTVPTGSGTTFNFTHYLSQVSPGWKSKFGEGTTVSWNGGIGGKGNEGVAGYVKQIPYRSAMSNMPT